MRDTAGVSEESERAVAREGRVIRGCKRGRARDAENKMQGALRKRDVLHSMTPEVADGA